MQALPTIPTTAAEPMIVGTPAESTPAAATTGKNQFSQHLTTANETLSVSDQNASTVSKEGESTAIQGANPGGQTDETIILPEKLVGFAANGINPSFEPEPIPLPGLPAASNKNPSIGNSVDQLALTNTLQQTGGKTITDATSLFLDSLGLKNGQKGPNASLIKTSVVNSDRIRVVNPGEPSVVNPDQIRVVNPGEPSVVNSSETRGGNSTVSKPGTELTIEHWRAQFRHQSVTAPQGLENARAAFTKPMITGKETLQDPILAYNSAEFTELAAPSRAKSGSGIQLPSQRQDANSNFIHSNLPSVGSKTDGNENKGMQQQNDSGQKTMPQEILAHVEQATTAKAGQETPLVFSLQQESTSVTSPQSQAAATSPMLRLPSGTEVPHNQIVNQVIDRFTLNRTLESGSITMKLHPQELGELRMEIKIEQDNIKAHITTQNPQVQEILDRHLPRLREALEAQGLNLEQMQVSVASDSNSNTQQFQEHFNRQQTARPQRTNDNDISFSLEEEIAAEEQNSSGNHQNLSVHI